MFDISRCTHAHTQAHTQQVLGLDIAHVFSHGVFLGRDSDGVISFYPPLRKSAVATGRGWSTQHTETLTGSMTHNRHANVKSVLCVAGDFEAIEKFEESYLYIF